MASPEGEWVPHKEPLPVQDNAFKQYLNEEHEEPVEGMKVSRAGIVWTYTIKVQDKIDD